MLTEGNSILGLDLKSGNALNSFTAQSDIGRFVAYVLTNLSRSKLEWRVFRIEAERKVRKYWSHDFAKIAN